MTAEEIRVAAGTAEDTEYDPHMRGALIDELRWWLAEIAAQLAELNEHFRYTAGATAPPDRRSLSQSFDIE